MGGYVRSLSGFLKIYIFSLLIKVQIIIYNSISLELIYKAMLICLVLICSPDVWKFPPLPLSFFFSFLPLFYLTFDSPSSNNSLCSSLSLLPLKFYSPISLDFYPFLTQIYRNIIFNKKGGGGVTLWTPLVCLLIFSTWF